MIPAYQHRFDIEAGNFNGATAGTVVPPTPVRMGSGGAPILSRLCVVVTVDAETDTFAPAGRWEVSQDKSNWVPVAHGSQNASGVPFATGTAGADAVVTKAFAAPDCIEAWPWARFVFVTSGTTGTMSDTYSAQYSARELIFGGKDPV